MKLLRGLALIGLVSMYLFGASEGEVISIVDKAVNLVKSKGCKKALEIIGKKNGEFHKGSLYVFGYDENVVMVVHPVKPYLVGKSYKGKPDVRGKKFRDEIVKNGLNGGGWTTYTYQKPGTSGLHKKKTYSKSANCDGKKIVLAAGMYAN